MGNDASTRRQVAKFLTLFRAERHGCILKANSRGAPCPDCLKQGTQFADMFESLVRLGYMQGHDDCRRNVQAEPERGVMAALRAHPQYQR